MPCSHQRISGTSPVPSTPRIPYQSPRIPRHSRPLPRHSCLPPVIPDLIGNPEPGHRVALLLLALTLFLSAAEGRTLYVAQTGDGSDGASWETAFTTVSNALAEASHGDSVWVREGTYAEALSIENSVSLYGGFAGVEANTEFHLRDSQARPTVLDATGLETSVITIHGVNGGTVDGFTIRGGDAPVGGGIRIETPVQPLRVAASATTRRIGTTRSYFWTSWAVVSMRVGRSNIRILSCVSHRERSADGEMVFRLGFDSGNPRLSWWQRNVGQAGDVALDGGGIYSETRIFASRVARSGTIVHLLQAGGLPSTTGDPVIETVRFAGTRGRRVRWRHLCMRADTSHTDRVELSHFAQPRTDTGCWPEWWTHFRGCGSECGDCTITHNQAITVEGGIHLRWCTTLAPLY